MKKILLVEDEVMIALSASMVLEEEGYAVSMAANGAEGLAKALHDPPDLIITDYMMPRLDGLAMIAALREKGMKVPVILATSIAADRLVDGSAAPPFDAYLAKPYRDTDLVRAVEELLD